MDRIIQRRVQTEDKKGISRTICPEMEAAYNNLRNSVNKSVGQHAGQRISVLI